MNAIKRLDTKLNDNFAKIELMNMLREQFNLRIQSKSGQLKKLHLLKKIRRDIACFKFYSYKK